VITYVPVSSKCSESNRTIPTASLGLASTSSGQIDRSLSPNYWSWRPQTTLATFAHALAEGVSYRDSYHTRKNGRGPRLTGHTREAVDTDPDPGDQIAEVWAGLFTLPGLPASKVVALRSGR
jgi:hypothetical protein